MYLSNNKEKKFESLVFYNFKGFLMVERYILYESIKAKPQDAYKRLNRGNQELIKVYVKQVV